MEDIPRILVVMENLAKQSQLIIPLEQVIEWI